MPKPVRSLAFIAAMLAGFTPSDSIGADEQNFGLIERGRYLAVVSDCAACHSMEGNRPYAGGRSIETPFGNLLAPNITPDRETGIGALSDKDFMLAVKAGIGRDGRHLYPAMPYVYFAKMKDEDVLAIRAYLATLEPVRNSVIPNQLPFPLNIRAAMAVWNWLYYRKGDWQPVPGKSEEWNRGAYLVEGPMHCGACHTPKSFLGGDLTHRIFEGYSLQGWRAPNITSSKTFGIGNWRAEELVQFLRTGHNRIASAAGPMGEEIERSSSKMSDEDLRAVATYLQDRPSNADEPAYGVAASDPQMKAGEAIYRDSCSACHKLDGKGVPDLFPALRDSPAIRASDPISLVRVLVQGVRSVATEGAPTGPGMPSYGWQLSDAQMAAVLTYVRNAWGNAAGAVSEGQVRSTKQSLQARME